MNAYFRSVKASGVVLFLCLYLMTYSKVSSAAVILREVDNWFAFTPMVVSLDTVSGNHGKWSRREYRISSGALIRCTILESTSIGMWHMPEVSLIQTDGLLGSGCTYRHLSVLNFPALFETHPILGNSLIIRIDKNTVFTLESDSTTEESIVEAAKMLLQYNNEFCFPNGSHVTDLSH